MLVVVSNPDLPGEVILDPASPYTISSNVYEGRYVGIACGVLRSCGYDKACKRWVVEIDVPDGAFVNVVNVLDCHISCAVCYSPCEQALNPVFEFKKLSALIAANTTLINANQIAIAAIQTCANQNKAAIAALQTQINNLNFVETVTGPFVNNTDPQNPVVGVDPQTAVNTQCITDLKLDVAAISSVMNIQADLQPTGNPNEYTVVLTYTDADGAAQSFTDPTPIVVTGSGQLAQATFDPATGNVNYFDANGNQLATFDLCASIATCPAITSLNNRVAALEAVNICNVVATCPVIAAINTRIDNLVDIDTYISNLGIDLQATGNPNEYTVVLNYTDQNGNPVTVNDPTPIIVTGSGQLSNVIDNGDGTVNFVDAAGNVLVSNFDICAVIDACSVGGGITGSITDNGDHTATVNIDGSSCDFPTTLREITHVPGTGFVTTFTDLKTGGVQQFVDSFRNRVAFVVGGADGSGPTSNNGEEGIYRQLQLNVPVMACGEQLLINSDGGFTWLPGDPGEGTTIALNRQFSVDNSNFFSFSGGASLYSAPEHEFVVLEVHQTAFRHTGVLPAGTNTLYFQTEFIDIAGSTQRGIQFNAEQYYVTYTDCSRCPLP